MEEVVLSLLLVRWSILGVCREVGLQRRGAGKKGEGQAAAIPVAPGKRQRRRPRYLFSSPCKSGGRMPRRVLFAIYLKVPR